MIENNADGDASRCLKNERNLLGFPYIKITFNCVFSKIFTFFCYKIRKEADKCTKWNNKIFLYLGKSILGRDYLFKIPHQFDQ